MPLILIPILCGCAAGFLLSGDGETDPEGTGLPLSSRSRRLDHLAWFLFVVAMVRVFGWLPLKWYQALGGLLVGGYLSAFATSRLLRLLTKRLQRKLEALGSDEVQAFILIRPLYLVQRRIHSMGVVFIITATLAAFLWTGK